jgi:hypothetical protein
MGNAKLVPSLAVFKIQLSVALILCHVLNSSCVICRKLTGHGDVGAQKLVARFS